MLERKTVHRSTWASLSLFQSKEELTLCTSLRSTECEKAGHDLNSTNGKDTKITIKLEIPHWASFMGSAIGMDMLITFLHKGGIKHVGEIIISKLVGCGHV